MRKKIWRFTVVLVLVLMVLTFSPLVVPERVHHPYFMGIPYTMWMGFLETLLLLGLTYLATRVHPGRDD